MNVVIYERLKDVARQGKTISYSEVGTLGDWDVSDNSDHAKMVAELEAIAEHETNAGRPLLVIVVLGGERNMPGKGLFDWAKKRRLQNGRDDIEFFANELRRVYDYWKSAPL